MWKYLMKQAKKVQKTNTTRQVHTFNEKNSIQLG